MASSIWINPSGVSNQGGTIGFPLGTQLTETALGTLAMVSSSAANQFQIPNGSNAEYASIGWAANFFNVGTVANGGSARPVRILTGAGQAIVISPAGSDVWQFTSAGSFSDLGTHTISVGGVLTTNTAANVLATGVALTDFAAAQVATLTNGPTAGNPTKWISINDNGTARKIPAW